MILVRRHWAYVLACLLIPVILLFPLIVGHTLYFGNDMPFHVSRFYEIAEHLKHGSYFSYINTYSFNGAGIPLNLMYGPLLIYPVSVCMIITGNIEGIYLGIALVISLSMLVSYFSYYGYSKDQKEAFLFSVLYNISIYSFGLFIDGFNFGEAAGMVWLPMIVYGIWLLFQGNSRNNGWVYVALGLSLTIYNHVLSFVMFSGLLIILFVIGWIKTKRLKLNVLMDVSKAVVLCIGLSMFYISGFLSIYMQNKMRLADHGKIVGINPSSLIIDTLNNQYYIGGLVFVLLIVTMLHYNLLKFESRLAIALSVIIAFAMTSYANLIWKFINYTPLTLIQWTGRFTVIVQLFACITICDYFYNYWYLNNVFRFICFIGLVIVFFMGNLISWKDRVINYPTVAKSAQVFPSKDYKVNNNKTLKRMVSGHYSSVGSLDYLKFNSYSNAQTKDRWESHIGEKPVNVVKKSIPNGIIYKLKINKSGLLDTPFYDYTDYRVTVNSHHSSYLESHRGTLAVPVKKGRNNIVIKYNEPKIVIFGKFISIFSVICLIAYQIKYWLSVRNRNGKNMIEVYDV